MKPFNLEKYLKNPNQKIITKDGRNVRIICIDRSGLNVKPIVALIMISNGDEIIKTYWENGVETRGYEGCQNDLFFVTEKKIKWLNIYKNTIGNFYPGCFYKTKEEAFENKSISHGHYIDTVKVEIEE